MLYSADFVFPVSQPPVRNGIVEVDGSGTIKNVCSPEEFKGDRSLVKYYKGILCPGFVNVHCHLELSHLKGKFAEGTGLDDFIKQVEQQRSATPDEIGRAMEEAEQEMIRNGIVAVGDISNTIHSFSQKSKNNLYYHTFIELLGFHPGKAERAFEAGLDIYAQLQGKGSLTLHAPYSASVELMDRIQQWALENHGLLSMHNQESEEENLLFLEKRGRILDRLAHFGIDTSFFQPTGKSSLRSALEHLPAGNRTLLVHNTYTSQQDIDWAMAHHRELYWCFCPNANLYIENRLPDIPLFVRNGCIPCIGTDSLASNRGLSVLSELKSIQKRFDFPLHQLITWATVNGAAFLGVEKTMGTLEAGKTPGLNLVTNCAGEQLNENSEVIKLA